MTNLTQQIEEARAEMEDAGRKLDAERGESKAVTFMDFVTDDRTASELTERRYKTACKKFDALMDQARAERRKHESENGIDGAPC